MDFSQGQLFRLSHSTILQCLLWCNAFFGKIFFPQNPYTTMQAQNNLKEKVHTGLILASPYFPSFSDLKILSQNIATPIIDEIAPHEVIFMFIALVYG